LNNDAILKNFSWKQMRLYRKQLEISKMYLVDEITSAGQKKGPTPSLIFQSFWIAFECGVIQKLTFEFFLIIFIRFRTNYGLAPTWISSLFYNSFATNKMNHKIHFCIFFEPITSTLVRKRMKYNKKMYTSSKSYTILFRWAWIDYSRYGSTSYW
jgi:hypothetical protein